MSERVDIHVIGGCQSDTATPTSMPLSLPIPSCPGTCASYSLREISEIGVGHRTPPATLTFVAYKYPHFSALDAISTSSLVPCIADNYV